jgi:hypothetical protein
LLSTKITIMTYCTVIITKTKTPLKQEKHEESMSVLLN